MSDIIVKPAESLPPAVSISSEWLEKAKNLVEEASLVKSIASQESYDDAGVLLKRLTSQSNSADDIRKEAVRPINEYLKQIKSTVDNARLPLEEEKARLKKMMSGYAKEVEDRRMAEIRAQGEAIAADEFSDLEPSAIPSVDTRKVSGAIASATKVWKFEIENPTKVPREFCTPDVIKIREYVRANKAAAAIPGVRTWEELEVKAR